MSDRFWRWVYTNLRKQHDLANAREILRASNAFMDAQQRRARWEADIPKFEDTGRYVEDAFGGEPKP